ncbi:hypothetical protein [Clostridium botulinum]|uniref:hypothetical protein n=1 Tax=Clostridium botulinum TaxID=1491 RepID=UPI001E2B1508|nr:hypothetical protein [Clostridium botulinum]MCD3254351.1 hypothetical protein [Clostridium botulinum C/D]MCD3279851.1 hypothetical protein [Clostridium botulinum C/D]MCD3339582.1 hypothetical protein [Clostridium botulinum C/D]MCD3357490.1 hypothetical protein [Clostridium botulinum C/D]
MDIENRVDNHEVRIKKLEESNVKMELQLQEISKGQSDLKALIYATQQSTQDVLKESYQKMIDTVTSTINTDNNIKLTDRKEFWGILGTIIGVGVMIAQYFFK